MFNLDRSAIISTVAGFLALFATNGTAVAELSISPLRQVIDSKNREVSFEVSNPSSRTVDIRANWIDLKATKFGYAPAEQDQRSRLSAAPYLIVEPARFRLQPGDRRHVTIKLRPGAKTDQKERRSHLLLTTEAQREPLIKTSGLQADIGLGVSVPVILRNRRLRAKAAISEAALTRDEIGNLQLEAEISRKSAVSPYGRLEVDFVSQTGAKVDGIPTVKLENVAVHFDIQSQVFEIPLKVEQFPPGVLTLRYIGSSEYEGREFASKKFEILPLE